MFRYETHLHSSLVSACSRMTPEEAVEKYTRLGYTGIFVTDHFLNGNTTVPRELPWQARIERFCDGYRAVQRAAECTDLAVFFGFEYSYKGTDFLVYGLEEDWLLRHAEIMDMTTREFIRFAKSEGGLVIQAHPCREDYYIDHVRLFPSDVDGFEVYNAGRPPRTNRLAEMYAAEYDMCRTAGSDIHNAQMGHLGGMEFCTKLKSGKDYADRIKRGEGKIFKFDDPKFLDK